jgi:hypothetical protein
MKGNPRLSLVKNLRIVAGIPFSLDTIREGSDRIAGVVDSRRWETRVRWTKRVIRMNGENDQRSS